MTPKITPFGARNGRLSTRNFGGRAGALPPTVQYDHYFALKTCVALIAPPKQLQRVPTI